jgi:hypothetical protein
MSEFNSAPGASWSSVKSSCLLQGDMDMVNSIEELVYEVPSLLAPSDQYTQDCGQKI